MTIKVHTHADKNVLRATILSLKTSRMEYVAEPIHSKGLVKNGMIKPEDVGLEAARRRLEARVEAFRQNDEEISAIYHIKMRRLGLRLDDVTHFSDAEMKNLEERLDMDSLQVFAQNLGLEAEAFEQKSGEATSGLRKHKALILQLLAKDPEIDLGLFLSKDVLVKETYTRRLRTLKERAGLSYRLKDEVKEQVLSVNPSDKENLILKDATLIGAPFRSKKVEQFLTSLSEGLKEARSYQESKKIIDQLERFSVMVDGVFLADLKREVWKNPLFNEFAYDATPKEMAYHDALNDATFDVLAASVERLIDKVVFDDNETNTPWYQRISDFKEVRAQTTPLIEDYLATLRETGASGDLVARLVSAGQGLHQELERAKIMYDELKPWVITRLKDEGKPATKRRVEIKIEEFIAEKGANRYFSVSKWGGDFKAIFGDTVAAAEASIQEKEKTKPEASFSAKRIKKPERAAEELSSRWANLGAEDRVILLTTTLSSLDGFRALLSSGGAARVEVMVMALEMAEKTVTDYRDALLNSYHRRLGLQAGSYILAALVEMGREDQVNWDDMSKDNILELLPDVPESYLAKAIGLFCRLGAKAEAHTDLLGEALERLGGKMSDATAKELYESFAYLADEAPATLPVLEKHLGRFLEKDKRFYRILYVSAVKNEATGVTIDPKKVMSLDDPELCFFLFRWAHKAGNKPVARQFLKKALEDSDVFQDVAPLLSIGENWGMTRPVSLFTASDVASDPDYADILIAVMRQKKIMIKGAGGSSFYSSTRRSNDDTPSSLKAMEVLFEAAKTPLLEQEEIIVEIYSKDSPEYFFFKSRHEKLSEGDVVAVVLARLKEADQKVKEHHRGEAEDSYYARRDSRASDETQGVLRLQPRHLPYLNALVCADARFATLRNVTSAPSSVLTTLEERARGACLYLASEAFETYKNHNYHDKLSHFLTIFSGDEALSLRLILKSSMTPLQAAICAETLERNAVEAAKERLVELCEKSEKALERLTKVVDVELAGKLAQRLASRPDGLRDRVLSGDKSLGEKEWETLLSSRFHVSAIFEKSAANTKLIKQIIALGETYDLDLTECLGATCRSLSTNDHSGDDFKTLTRLYLSFVGVDGERSARLLAGRLAKAGEAGDMATLEDTLSFAEELGVECGPLIDELAEDLISSICLDLGDRGKKTPVLASLMGRFGVSGVVTSYLGDKSWIKSTKVREVLGELGLEDKISEVEKLRAKEDVYS